MISSGLSGTSLQTIWQLRKKIVETPKGGKECRNPDQEYVQASVETSPFIKFPMMNTLSNGKLVRQKPRSTNGDLSIQSPNDLLAHPSIRLRNKPKTWASLVTEHVQVLLGSERLKNDTLH